MTAAQKTLTDMLTFALAGKKYTAGVDCPAEVWKEAVMQGVALLAFGCAETDNFEETLKAEISVMLKQYLARNITVSLAHSELSALLEKENIPHIILKGCASAEYYPSPDLRQLGDVDFLIDKTDFERTAEILKKNGYSLTNDRHAIHFVFVKKGVRFEMHLEPAGVPSGDKETVCRGLLADAVSSAAKQKTVFGEMFLPSKFHHGLIILLHTVHHLTLGGIGLRQLCDWSTFISSLDEGEFYDLFYGPLSKLGLWTAAATLTRVCEKHLGLAQSTASSDADEKTADALFEDVLSGGNFGQKDISRQQQAYLITSGKKNGSLPKQLFHEANDIVYLKWPVSKKLKFLLPLGWAFYGVRYFSRMITGKRPKINKQTAADAAARSQIYDALKIFKTAEENK